MLNKEQSKAQSTVQSSVKPSIQSTEQSSVQYTVQSNNTYVYSVGILAVLAISVCVFFTYKASLAKKEIVNEKQNQLPKRRHMFQKKWLVLTGKKY